MPILPRVRYIVCFCILFLNSCVRYYQRAFYMPNASLSNIDSSGQLIGKDSNDGLTFNQNLLIRHEIDSGQNMVLLFSEIRNVFFIRDADSYKLITIELPVDSLSSNGNFNVNNSEDKVKNAVTSGGVQWIYYSRIGMINQGRIKYRQINDSIYSVHFRLNIDVTSIKDSLENYNFNYNKRILFQKSNLKKYQKIPN